ncbi:serine hydrolase family protein [Orientia chuto str. Dubai]|uniref:Serine hydrolase family protein n=1 Tax=Orientia chuto str. Dubai TaxID=1359168 RepID=A0A0F3MRF6_9RICK|nr:peptidase [Candidatus Orientia mediorientalis]KJV57174.1 serine hydrolase family protein [Orientia chuto str. Dubai]
MSVFSKRQNLILISIISFLLSSHINASYKARVNRANKVILNTEMKNDIIKTNSFFLTIFHKIKNPNLNFVFYIEGDGLIYYNNSISDNPTPLLPLVLELAIIDPRPNVVYIARPCQYVSPSLQQNCKKEYWTSKRFAKEVVEAINEVIIKISNNQPSDIIGYSGGGGLAVLVAAINPNIKTITTIAGNLDHIAFNNFHNSPHMTDSLNPIDYAESVKNIPQLHLTGIEDKIVPLFIIDKFAKHANFAKVIKFKSISHDKGWKSIWQNICTE